MNNRTFSDYSLLVLKGVAMGIANKIPGVSGGIVAVVTGFYRELIFSFQRLNIKAIELLLSGRFSSFWKYTNGAFLCALLAGVILSYFTLSLLLDLALTTYPVYVWASFFGLVLASAILLFRRYNSWSRQNICLALLGLVVGIGLSVLSPSSQNTHILYVFFCGMISIVGMTLPGLSGSFLLILLGNYTLLLVDAVNAFGKWVVSLFFSNIDISVQDENYALLFGVFLAGSLAGIGGLSALIHRIQQKADKELQAILIGFVFGSLFILWPYNKTSHVEPTALNQTPFWAMIWGLLGMVSVFILEYYERRK